MPIYTPIKFGHAGHTHHEIHSFMNKSYGIFIHFQPDFQVASHHGIFIGISWFNFMGKFHGLLLCCSKSRMQKSLNCLRSFTDFFTDFFRSSECLDYGQTKKLSVALGSHTTDHRIAWRKSGVVKKYCML